MSTMVATEPEVMPKTEVTPEELLAMPDGGHYELIDGELKERRVSFLSNLVAAEVTAILRQSLSLATISDGFSPPNLATVAFPGIRDAFAVPMSRSSGLIA